jgi:cyclin-dependent kinase regulatory subunit CKS1
MLKVIPNDYFADPNKGLLKLLWEEEWRGLGITQVQLSLAAYGRVLLTINFLQSLGWEHYEIHEPEPHMLLFK